MSSPFECPVCFDLYDGEKFLPTTFVCGHSCCLIHVEKITQCPICRVEINLECVVNVALRDGSIEFQKMKAQLELLSLAPMTSTTQETESNEDKKKKKKPRKKKKNHQKKKLNPDGEEEKDEEEDDDDEIIEVGNQIVQRKQSQNTEENEEDEEEPGYWMSHQVVGFVNQSIFLDFKNLPYVGKADPYFNSKNGQPTFHWMYRGVIYDNSTVMSPESHRRIYVKEPMGDIRMIEFHPKSGSLDFSQLVVDYTICIRHARKSVFPDNKEGFRIVDLDSIFIIPMNQAQLMQVDMARLKWVNDKRCWVCNKKKGVNRCSRCKVAMYCGRECQSQHWSTHKKQCDLIPPYSRVLENVSMPNEQKFLDIPPNIADYLHNRK